MATDRGGGKVIACPSRKPTHYLHPADLALPAHANLAYSLPGSHSGDKGNDLDTAADGAGTDSDRDADMADCTSCNRFADSIHAAGVAVVGIESCNNPHARDHGHSQAGLARGDMRAVVEAVAGPGEA